LTGLLETLGLLRDAPGSAPEILRTIDKLPSQGERAVRKLLAEENGLSDETIERIFRFLRIDGEPEQMLEEAERLVGECAVGREGVDELRAVIAFTGDLGVPGFELDFSIARGLDYYTGTVFETFLLDLPDLGSVMSGGRYDHLISGFLGRDMPAVGISAGIDRLFSGMERLGLVETTKTPTRVLVAPMGAATVGPALRAASRLRRAGIATEVYLGDARLGKQLKHADRQGIGVVVILGGDELAAGEATVKEMDSGEQARVPLDELSGEIERLLA
ncbi:MAG: HisS family protein, partial [Planctomycetota bacterium]